NKSIEVLRELESDKSRSSNNVRSFGLYTQSGDLSHRNIDFINFVLEEYFDTWLKDVKQIKADNTIKIEKKERNGFKKIPILSSVFMYMYHCIFAGDMKCIIPNSQDNVSMSVKDMKDFFISGKPLEEEQKELTFYDTYSGLRITEQAIYLWNTYNMNIVTKWLNDKREEVSKNGKH
ncbi:MAG: hypothetical protein K6E53_08000, partial [Lachnospiraceae bacterium]|nr:hypothetical protein [Lachnospiraceae bacterium]